MNEYLPTSTANGLPHNLQRGERLASIGAGLVLAGFGPGLRWLARRRKAVAGGLLVSRGLRGIAMSRACSRTAGRVAVAARRGAAPDLPPAALPPNLPLYGPRAWRRAHREEGETMASQLFLISYILDDQPMTCELHSEAETLSREEARRHLEALHRPHDAEAISDIQVSKVERTHEPGTTPGHYQQP